VVENDCIGNDKVNKNSNLNLIKFDRNAQSVRQNTNIKNLESNIEALFSSPGVIIKDLFDLYSSDKPRLERNSALVNYVQLLFQNTLNW